MAAESSRNHKNSRARGPNIASLARSGMQQLGELLQREPEGVVSVCRDEQTGWQVCIDVVEVHRIPETADVLATYQLDIDDDGQLTGYHRVRRYVRGRVED